MKTIERLILTALLRDMRAAGYRAAAVWDGDEYNLAGSETEYSTVNRDGSPATIERALTDDEALFLIDSVDDCTLHFTRQNADTWGNRGVFIVLGNDEDCISDYHAPKNEPFCDVITAIYDRVEKGLLP
jgi:hypothetical protein